MERERQAHTRALPYNLSATDAAGALLRPLPTVRTPQLLKAAAFSGELLLTTGSRHGPEGPGVDSLTSGQFSDNAWWTWGSTHLHSCLKLGQLYGDVYAPEPHWDQAEARAQRSPCPYLAPSPPSPSSSPPASSRQHSSSTSLAKNWGSGSTSRDTG